MDIEKLPHSLLRTSQLSVHLVKSSIYAIAPSAEADSHSDCIQEQKEDKENMEILRGSPADFFSRQ